ncbi:hypothetical protein MJ1_0238 [Nanobdella aerobiophila]|uniref:Uncharacterized protein n=1 Tax=Nanobdella aerobiophila TaxID=2586965 RepID=A0A915SZR1_9ARCH|nr:hypothetical protein [Nanobdella aerobiophila]BBL45409.1 hypothetical protein MJ1_0238 [Nanobdella aerobiophila]
MPEYEIIPQDPIDKLTQEIENLKTDLRELKGQLKDNIENIKRELSLPNENNPLLRKEVNYSQNFSVDISFYKEIVNSLIKSNVDLQAKISELVVVSNNLYREIKNLLDIFKEAAISRKEAKNDNNLNNVDILKRLENLEKANLKIAELLDSFKKYMDNSKDNNVKPVTNNNPLYRKI